MTAEPNFQYNVTAPNSLADRIGKQMRRKMYDIFIDEFAPTAHDSILDVGVTSDRSFRSSNYFEEFYPYKHNVTAAGIDDASFLETLYPGLKFVPANALDLPFDDGAFHLVHSSAVLEHVGSVENQARMIGECLRVARRGVFVTTPNRWFPVELHTRLPLVHWLPKETGRAVMRRLGYDFFAMEENLNLLTRSELKSLAERNPGWRCKVELGRLLGVSSNLLLVAERLKK